MQIILAIGSIEPASNFGSFSECVDNLPVFDRLPYISDLANDQIVSNTIRNDVRKLSMGIYFSLVDNGFISTRVFDYILDRAELDYIALKDINLGIESLLFD